MWEKHSRRIIQHFFESGESLETCARNSRKKWSNSLDYLGEKVQQRIRSKGELDLQGGWPAWAPEISSSLFSLRSGHPDFIFPLTCRIKWKRLDIRVKNNKFRSLFGQKCLWCKIFHKSAHFFKSNTAAHDRLDDPSKKFGGGGGVVAVGAAELDVGGRLFCVKNTQTSATFC